MSGSIRKDRLLMASNFALYYGWGRSEELSRFEMVIIEPKGMTEEDIHYMQKHNTMVISYLSVMEVHPDDEIFSKLEEEDFLFIGDKKMMNEPFGTYLVNLRSKRWIEYLIGRVDFYMNKLGTDGIFLDTMGDIEMPDIKEPIRSKQIEAVTNLLFSLKLLYPEHLLIQNNGLESLYKHTAPFIDGIVWENPPFTLKESKAWAEKTIDKLNQLQKEWSIRVLLLLEKSLEEERRAYMVAKKISRENNFLLYLASANYTDGVSPIKG